MDKYEALTNKLIQPNPHAIGVMKLLKDNYPAFAVKVIEKNPVVELMALTNLCSLRLISYPICGHCETTAFWKGYELINNEVFPFCLCKKCGSKTVNPVTFKQFCKMELKKKAPHITDEMLEMAVDLFAERCVADAERIYLKIANKENVNVQAKMSGRT